MSDPAPSVKARRAHPRLRMAAWVALAAGVLVGGLAVASNRLHAEWVVPSSVAIKVTGGRVWVAAMTDPAASISIPKAGFRVSRAPTGHAIGTIGAAVTDRVFPGIERCRAVSGGRTMWVTVSVPLAVIWLPMTALALAGVWFTRRYGPGFCGACGYPRSGLPAGVGRCPECGAPVGPEGRTRA